MSQGVVPSRFMNHGLAGWEKEHEHQEKKQAHPTVFCFAQACGLVENEGYAEVVAEEKQQWQQQGKHEEPKRELLKHAKDIGGEQTEHENETLGA